MVLRMKNFHIWGQGVAYTGGAWAVCLFKGSLARKRVFSKGGLSHYANGFTKRLLFFSQKYVKKCSCLFTVTKGVFFKKNLFSQYYMVHITTQIYINSFTRCSWKILPYHLCLYQAKLQKCEGCFRGELTSSDKNGELDQVRLIFLKRCPEVILS